MFYYKRMPHAVVNRIDSPTVCPESNQRRGLRDVLFQWYDSPHFDDVSSAQLSNDI